MKRGILSVAVTVGLMVSSQAFGQFFVFENPLIGKIAPDFTLPTVSGEQVSLVAYKGDKNAIVFFWATWCPHCRTQIQELNEARERLLEQGIHVVLVDIGEDKEKVKKFLDRNKISFNVFLDESTDIATAYDVVGVPTLFYLDQKGVVKAVEHSLINDLQEIFSD